MREEATPAASSARAAEAAPASAPAPASSLQQVGKEARGELLDRPTGQLCSTGATPAGGQGTW